MKKLFKTLLICLAIFCFPFVLVACDNNDKDKTEPKTTNVTVADVNTALTGLGNNFTADLSITLPQTLTSMIGSMAEVTLPTTITGLKLQSDGSAILLSAKIGNTFEGEIYIVDGSIYMREKENGVWGDFDVEQFNFADFVSFEELSLEGLDINKLVSTLETYGIGVTTSADKTKLTLKVSLADKIADVQNVIKVLTNSNTTIGDAINSVLEVLNYEYDTETYEKAVDALVAKIKSQITAQTTVSQLMDILCDEFNIDAEFTKNLLQTIMLQSQKSMEEFSCSVYSESIVYSYIGGEEEPAQEQEKSIFDAPVLALLSNMMEGAELSTDPAADNYFGKVIDNLLDLTSADLMNMFMPQEDSEVEENSEPEAVEAELDEEFTYYLQMIQMIANINISKFDINFEFKLNNKVISSVDMSLEIQISMSNNNSEENPTATAATEDVVLNLSASAQLEFSNIGTTAINKADLNEFISENLDVETEPVVVNVELDLTNVDLADNTEIAIYDSVAQEYLIADFEEVFAEDEDASFEIVIPMTSPEWDEEEQDFVETETDFTVVSLNKEKLVISSGLMGEILYRYTDDQPYNTVAINISENLTIVLNLTGTVETEE